MTVNQRLAQEPDCKACLAGTRRVDEDDILHPFYEVQPGKAFDLAGLNRGLLGEQPARLRI
jgi:hypothetical protein